MLPDHPPMRAVARRAFWEDDDGLMRRHPSKATLPPIYRVAYRDRPPESAWADVDGLRLQIMSTLPGPWLRAKRELAQRVAAHRVCSEFVEAGHDLLSDAPDAVAHLFDLATG